MREVHMASSFCWLTLPSSLIPKSVSCGVATSLLEALAFELCVNFALYILSWHLRLCWSPNLPCISTVCRLLWIWIHAIGPSPPAPGTHTVQGKELLFSTNPVACYKTFYLPPIGDSSALALYNLKQNQKPAGQNGGREEGVWHLVLDTDCPALQL